MDHREERSSFHSNFHSIGSGDNSRLLCILVEGDPTLGKCCWGCPTGWRTVQRVVGQEERRRRKGYK
ncbi:hypothetical protein V6N13_143301 [Hibiscus sabdariffa]